MVLIVDSWCTRLVAIRTVELGPGGGAAYSNSRTLFASVADTCERGCSEFPHTQPYGLVFAFCF